MAVLSIQSVEKLMGITSAAALVPAGVAGFYTHHAIKDALTEAGFTGMASPMAMAAAVGITVCYAAFVHMLLKGVAPLPLDERRRATPTIIAGTVTLLLCSAYPNIIVTGGGFAAGIEDRSYVAHIAEVGDQLKKVAQTAEQVDAIISSGASQLDAAARFENAGGLSGAPSQGVLAEAIRSHAQALRATQKDIGGTRERTADEIARIDMATDKMRTALADRSMALTERRTRMQRHGDEARSAAIAVAALTPVAPLQALADRLMGPQLEPRWSQNPEIRKSQEEGFRKLKDELKRLGKSLARHTSDLAQGLKVNVPVYNPQPSSVLVLAHAGALTGIFAFAAALDLLPLTIFGLACVMYDAARRRNEPVVSQPIVLQADPAAASEPRNHLAIETELGPHPHPVVARARTNGSGRRMARDGNDGTTE